LGANIGVFGDQRGRGGEYFQEIFLAHRRGKLLPRRGRRRAAFHAEDAVGLHFHAKAAEEAAFLAEGAEEGCIAVDAVKGRQCKRWTRSRAAIRRGRRGGCD
jgi:hypothetical protein